MTYMEYFDTSRKLLHTRSDGAEGVPIPKVGSVYMLPSHEVRVETVQTHTDGDTTKIIATCKVLRHL